MKRIGLWIAVVAAAPACGSSMTEDFCKRADTCNALVTSVEECIEDLDAALDRLSPSDRAEVEDLVQTCVDRPSCDGFRSCIQALRPAGGGDGDGDGGAAADAAELASYALAPE